MKKIVLGLTALAIAFASCSNGSDTPIIIIPPATENTASGGSSGTDGATTSSGGTETGVPATTPDGTTETPTVTPAPEIDTPVVTPGGTNGETDIPTATPDTTTGATTGGITVDDDGTVTIDASKMVFIGDDTETIDGVEYKVKKYAQLASDDNPYFYTYYKLYYLNDKLRRLYSIDHGIGSETDYKYDEFVEHQCGTTKRYPTIYAYHENGKIEAYIFYNTLTLSGNVSYCARREYFYDTEGRNIKQCVYHSDGLYEKNEFEYDSNGNTIQTKSYRNTNPDKPSEGTVYLTSINTYYESGKEKTKESYSNGKLSEKKTCLENGKTESWITYAADGVTEKSKTLYTYYDNGKQKTYESYTDGKPSTKYEWYESGNAKTWETYSNGMLYEKYTYYESSNTRTGYSNTKTDERYSNGKLSVKKTYLENGELESKITYAADGVTEKSKVLCVYYESGNPQKAELYSDGKLKEFYTFYDEKNDDSVYVDGARLYGKIKIKEKYTDGKLSAKYTFYESGKPQKKESYSGGVLKAIDTFYDEKGTYEVIFDDGDSFYVKIKSRIAYAADGVTETSKALYIYYESGNLQKGESYSDGKLTRFYTFYDEKIKKTIDDYVTDGRNYFYGIKKSQEEYTDGKLSRKTIWRVDHKTESDVTYAADGVTETSKALYTYYDNGNKKALEEYSDGNLSRKRVWLENGKIESDITYAADGVTEASKKLYTYYDNGKEKTYESYSNGKLSLKKEWYDNDNTKALEEYNNGKLSSKYTYLENGKTESCIYYAADGVTETSKTLYTYYSNGNKKTEEVYRYGKLSQKTTYNENGKLESEITYAADGVTETNKTLYTYYSDGNQKTEEVYRDEIRLLCILTVCMKQNFPRYLIHIQVKCRHFTANMTLSITSAIMPMLALPMAISTPTRTAKQGLLQPILPCIPQRKPTPLSKPRQSWRSF